MPLFAKWRLFQKTATGVLIVFLGLMVFVTIMAYSRPSGSTRQDMAKTQILRKEAVYNPKENSAEITLKEKTISREVKD